MEVIKKYRSLLLFGITCLIMLVGFPNKISTLICVGGGLIVYFSCKFYVVPVIEKEIAGTKLENDPLFKFCCKMDEISLIFLSLVMLFYMAVNILIG